MPQAIRPRATSHPSPCIRPSVQFKRLYDSSVCTIQASVRFKRLYDSSVCTIQASIRFKRPYDSSVCTIQASIRFNRLYDSSVYTIRASIRFERCRRRSEGATRHLSTSPLRRCGPLPCFPDAEIRSAPDADGRAESCGPSFSRRCARGAPSLLLRYGSLEAHSWSEDTRVDAWTDHPKDFRWCDGHSTRCVSPARRARVRAGAGAGAARAGPVAPAPTGSCSTPIQEARRILLERRKKSCASPFAVDRR